MQKQADIEEVENVIKKAYELASQNKLQQCGVLLVGYIEDQIPLPFGVDKAKYLLSKIDVEVLHPQVLTSVAILTWICARFLSPERDEYIKRMFVALEEKWNYPEERIKSLKARMFHTLEEELKFQQDVEKFEALTGSKVFPSFKMKDQN